MDYRNTVSLVVGECTALQKIRMNHGNRLILSRKEVGVDDGNAVVVRRGKVRVDDGDTALIFGHEVGMNDGSGCLCEKVCRDRGEVGMNHCDTVGPFHMESIPVVPGGGDGDGKKGGSILHGDAVTGLCIGFLGAGDLHVFQGDGPPRNGDSGPGGPPDANVLDPGFPVSLEYDSRLSLFGFDDEFLAVLALHIDPCGDGEGALHGLSGQFDGLSGLGRSHGLNGLLTPF